MDNQAVRASDHSLPAHTAGIPAKKQQKYIDIKQLFEFLAANKNPLGYLQEPSGNRNLLNFLAEKLGVAPLTIDKKLAELVELQYIALENYKKYPNRLFRVKVLINQWDPARISSVATPIRPPKAIGIPKTRGINIKRGFLLLVDYENVRRNLKPSDERLRNFAWLTEPLLKKGKIFMAVVFGPDSNAVPKMRLTQQGFYVIDCPRQMGSVITKDKDTVDAKMSNFASILIMISSELITDVVIISGDGDFQPLMALARFQQKKVTVRSAPDALSNIFREMQEYGMLTVETI